MKRFLILFLLLSNLGYSQLFKTDAPKFTILLDGVDEHINIDGVRTSLASTTKGTWSIWVKPVDATPTPSDKIIAFGDTDANEFIIFSIETSGLGRFFLRKAGTTQWDLDTDAAAFSDNTWIHVALVQDAISPVIYINAVAVAQTFTTSTDKTAWFNDLSGLDNGRLADFNFNSAGEAGFFNGNIDEVLFINTNLSSAEITTLYNSGKPKDESGISGGVTYLRMGENASFSANWTFVDQIGSNSGVSVNMTLDDRVVSTLIYEFPARLISSGTNLFGQ